MPKFNLFKSLKFPRVAKTIPFALIVIIVIFKTRMPPRNKANVFL